MTHALKSSISTGYGNAPRPGRIVLSFFGALGDLHPYLALARGVRERGHIPVIATREGYRGRVEALGIEFRPVPPMSLTSGSRRSWWRE